MADNQIQALLTALEAQLGFKGMGTENIARQGRYKGAARLWESGHITLMWDDAQLIINCMITSVEGPSSIKGFIHASLPWTGKLITSEDDMGEVT